MFIMTFDEYYAEVKSKIKTESNCFVDHFLPVPEETIHDLLLMTEEEKIIYRKLRDDVFEYNGGVFNRLTAEIKEKQEPEKTNNEATIAWSIIGVLLLLALIL